MEIAQIVLNLITQLPRPGRDHDERVRRAIDGFKAELDQDRAVVRTMLEQWAGLSPGDPGAAGRRLASPRLKATPRNERRQAITNRMLAYSDQLGPALSNTIDLAIKVALCEHELEKEDRRDRANANARDIKVAFDLYDDVAVAAQKLYDDFGVNRRHWACLNDDDLQAIAAVLLRQPMDGSDEEAAVNEISSDPPD